jgi:penicillin-insensitive murein endopeptidase
MRLRSTVRVLTIALPVLAAVVMLRSVEPLGSAGGGVPCTGRPCTDREARRDTAPALRAKAPGGDQRGTARGHRRSAARHPNSIHARRRIRWRHSEAIGLPHAGRLVRGVRLPAEGAHFFTWDPIRRRSPNRGWRRWGTDDLVRTTLRVVYAYAAAHPSAPRVGIGDLSRPHGGDFGAAFGAIGHATHQNGLDVDVYYPLRSGAERAPLSVDETDLALAQDLVDRFVGVGAVKVYVGPNTGLTGRPGVVEAIPLHDNHLHVRLPG